MEDYVSFETAKLLRDKGFDDEYTNAFYDKSGILYFIDLLSDFSEHPDNDTDIAASTLYVAMKWLREVHNIFISIQQHMDMSYVWYVYRDGVSKGCDRESHNNTYEQTCEVAIKYCLENLI